MREKYNRKSTRRNRNRKPAKHGFQIKAILPSDKISKLQSMRDKLKQRGEYK